MNLHDEICKLAYELYERSGRCEGRDAENWLEAERIVMARFTVVVPSSTETVPAKKAAAKTAAKAPRAAKTETKAKAAPKTKKAAKKGE